MTDLEREMRDTIAGFDGGYPLTTKGEEAVRFIMDILESPTPEEKTIALLREQHASAKAMEAHLEERPLTGPSMRQLTLAVVALTKGLIALQETLIEAAEEARDG